MRGRRNSIILRRDNEANDIIISPPPGTTLLILNILILCPEISLTNTKGHRSNAHFPCGGSKVSFCQM